MKEKESITVHTVQSVLETSEHLFSECSAYSDLREGLHMEGVLEDRCLFLRQVIKRRIGLEEKLRN